MQLVYLLWLQAKPMVEGLSVIVISTCCEGLRKAGTGASELMLIVSLASSKAIKRDGEEIVNSQAPHCGGGPLQEEVVTRSRLDNFSILAFSVLFTVPAIDPAEMRSCPLRGQIAASSASLSSSEYLLEDNPDFQQSQQTFHWPLREQASTESPRFLHVF
eukprot:TRINITY_DN2409_c0_g1_i1.p1 TRINITY_DN2409_c0_g1~~TRINITY_DN2409_c0_g1_i1.p1  ORF type:complete len:160 (-),score=5.75 TRINITY_DN2409_c0_g1_i1:18-497(-)